jgi:hypothetical protein
MSYRSRKVRTVPGRLHVRTEVFAPNPHEILQATLQAELRITRCELLEPALNEILIDRTADA